MKNSDHSELLFLRTCIDNVDAAILSILFHRAQLVNFIIAYKKLHDIMPLRSELRNEAIKNTLAFAANLKLRKAFVAKIFEHLFKESDHLYSGKIPAGVVKSLAADKNRLQQFNHSLKNLDMAFCSLLLERMELVQQVGDYKKHHHIAPLVTSRWEDVLQSKAALAKSLGIDPAAIRKLYTMIHEEALVIEAQCRSD